ncbi:MAG: enoyl-CoA hydratase-related protein [Rhodocyclaceae bacterium]|jgi:enoyl-CoA hydratase/carnithine racemase|nr:enoyl-CoA hydratase-related protein [Rhodocyclaceae bacterium]
MAYSQILYDVTDGICTITLNRPDKLNAFTGTMGDEIYDAFSVANADPVVKAIILTGAGTTFCAGVDLPALADPKEGKRIVETPLLSKFPLENYSNPKPTICALNGAAFGIGITMTLSFDIRIAEEGAKMAVPFTKLGMLPGLASGYLLPRLVGRGRALDLLLSARSFSAAEALQMGLVERVVPVGTALTVAKALAASMVKCEPFILAGVKEMVNFSSDSTIAEAVENEARLLAEYRAIKMKGLAK